MVTEKRRFSDFNWLPWQRPWRNQKTLKEVNKPLHPSTNPGNFVKIGPLVSELLGLESRPLKNKKIKKKYLALSASVEAG